MTIPDLITLLAIIVIWLLLLALVPIIATFSVPVFVLLASVVMFKYL